MFPPIETHWYYNKAYLTKPYLKQEIEAAVRAQAPARKYARPKWSREC